MTVASPKLKQKKSKLDVKPKQIVKNLISVLPIRARDVIQCRYGLAKSPQRMTLESIGKKYEITRERVRQIENYSLLIIRKSDEFKKAKKSMIDLKTYIDSMGSLIGEKELLESISKDITTQNHIYFLLVIGEQFKRIKEDDNYRHRWHVDTVLSDKIHSSIKDLYDSLTNDELITEPDIIKNFLDKLGNISDKYRTEEIARRWLCLSKNIGKNPLGEWGKSSSSNIKIKGMRDYAYLIIRKHGSPIHFKEVARDIQLHFNKKAHIATTHNELIKDPRFVLVGRGLYALSEWGYIKGDVKDVIIKILEKNAPMTREEITESVLKERYVKENTIMVNLQNTKFFKKNKEGKYSTL